MIKYQTETKKIGGSLWLRIPMKIVKDYKIQMNRQFDVVLHKSAHLGALPLVEYRCKGCEHLFTQSEEEPYCPACGCENLEIKEVDEIEDE